MDEPDEKNDDASLDLRRAATTALTAALAGALAGAAKAAVDKRGRSEAEEDDAGPDDGGEEQQQERPAAAAQDKGEPPHEPTEDDEDDEGSEDASEQYGARAVEAPHADDSEQTGAPSSDVASMIARAKQHVEAVLGSEPEGVSGIEHSNGSWRVNVEVVQMRRVPESTDILASYAVVLDGDGDLISVQEVRRYRRSQADDDR